MDQIRVPYTLPWWDAFLHQLQGWPVRMARRLNTVIDFFEWSCEGNLIMYVETLLPALGEFVLGLIDFDWDDVARGFMRPAGPASRKTLVFDPRKSKWRWEIPELGEEIGKRIPGAKFFKSSRVWGATRVLWVIDGVIQRALYWYMIVDLVSDFFYNWSSGILRHEACAQGGFIVEGGTYGDAGGEGWKDIIWWGPWSERRFVGDFDGIELDAPYIVARRPVSILYDFELVPVFPLECRMAYTPVLRRDDGKMIDIGVECYSWERVEDQYFFGLIRVNQTSKRGALGVFRIPAPGRYLLSAYVSYSTCYTIFQIIHRIVIK